VFIVLIIISMADANTQDARQMCTGSTTSTRYDLFSVSAVNLVAYALALYYFIDLSLASIRNPKVRKDDNGNEDLAKVNRGFTTVIFLFLFIVLAIMCVYYTQQLGPDCKSLLKTKSHAIPLDIAAYLCTAVDFVWAIAAIVYLSTLKVMQQ